MLHILFEVLLNAVLVTGLVVIMMMMIESLNIESRGRFFLGFKDRRFGGVLLGALLGAVPGCMGGFATVSLYTHGMLSFGALIAMMIASSGDEAFVMLAAFPEKAWLIFLILFGVALVSGLLTDLFVKRGPVVRCDESYAVHDADLCEHHHECGDEEHHHHGRHLSWKRGAMFLAVALFIAALAGGFLEHEHAEVHETATGFNLLSEDWMNIMFAVLSLFVLAVLVWGSDHFIEEHLWHHVVKKHLPGVFGWTFGVLLVISVLLQYVDISAWINDNVVLMILLATLIGVIPESGPHLVFVTLYAAGVLPLPVLLASCISQDGHASLPLIAESKSGFLKAKLVNCAVALAVGFAAMLFV